jgi:hypothetical protein
MQPKQEHYEQIKNAYNDFYKFLYVKHKMFPVKDTGVGFWGVSVADEVYDLFKRIELHKFKHMLDLGSGDGKVVMIGSLFTKSSGIEFDPWLISVSHDVKNKLMHIPSVNKTTFHKGDYKNHNLSEYDILFLNPDNEPHQIQSKILKEFKGVLILYGRHTELTSLRTHSKHMIDGTPITLYKVN